MSEDFKAAFRAAQAQRGLAAKPVSILCCPLNTAVAAAWCCCLKHALTPGLLRCLCSQRNSSRLSKPKRCVYLLHALSLATSSRATPNYSHPPPGTSCLSLAPCCSQATAVSSQAAAKQAAAAAPKAAPAPAASRAGGAAGGLPSDFFDGAAVSSGVPSLPTCMHCWGGGARPLPCCASIENTHLQRVQYARASCERCSRVVCSHLAVQLQ
jgi:hypothetical protein